MLIRTQLEFEDNYSQIPNAWLRDPRLSLKAKGLLAQILTHTPGWSMTILSLAKANNCGRDAIRSAINELVVSGYLERSETRERDAYGRLGDYTYTTVSPDPAQFTYAGKPYVGKTYVGKSDTKNNQDIDLYRKKNNIKKDIDIKRGTRITEDWQPSELILKWAMRERPELDHTKVIDEFKDYWIAIPGQKGVKLNWDSTYRNWVRRTRQTSDTPKKSATQRNMELHAKLFNTPQQKAPQNELGRN